MPLRDQNKAKTLKHSQKKSAPRAPFKTRITDSTSAWPRTNREICRRKTGLHLSTIMFSTAAASNSTRPLLGNTRRRQRTSSGDDVKPPKAKRQRSALRHDDSREISALGQRDDAEVNGIDTETEESLQVVASASATFGELPLRGPRKADKQSRVGISALLVGNFWSQAELLAGHMWLTSES